MSEYSWEFVPGEMEAWKKWFLNTNEILPKYKCSAGHVMESPIPMPQEELDMRCIECKTEALHDR